MTIPPLSDEDDLRLAEYALGVLDHEARAQVLQQAQDHPLFAAELAQWEHRFAPLIEDIEPVAPPPEVWHRIQHQLGFDDAPLSPRSARSNGVWNNVRFWRWLGVGTSGAFVALIAAVATTLVQFQSNDDRGLAGWLDRLRTPAAAPSNYRVANLVQTSGATAWIATLDVATSRLIVVPAGDSHIATDRAAELWLVPLEGKPVALGLLTNRGPAILTLPDAVAKAFADKSSLAVSLEPTGGSPTGQPTGPILAQGAVRAS